jgi:hypothetical protein
MDGPVPEVLSGWTLDVVRELSIAGRTESETHDFKHSLPERDRLTTLCCAFANTRGGFIILGVEEGHPWKVVGVEPNKEIYSDFMDRVHAEPQIDVSMPIMLPLPGTPRVLYLFHVPRGRRRPHTPTEKDKRAFWKRVGTSCERMTRDEVRALMVDEEELRQKLGLLLLELGNIAWSLESSKDPNDGTLYTFEIIDRVTVEAYSVLREDPQTIKVLATAKRSLMRVNAATQRFLLESARGTKPPAGYYKMHEDAARAALAQVVLIREQIERSFKERFGITVPG